MVQAEWLDEKWEVTQEKKRLIKTFSTSKSVKTKTDSDTGETKITGTTLSTVTLVFNTAIGEGGNPRAEFNALQEKIGKTDTLCIGKYSIGADFLMLNSVKISSQTVDNNGLILYADIELTFLEVSPPETNSEMSICIDGKDITNTIAVEKCVNEQYAEGHADILELQFSDPYKEWGKWAKQDEMHGLPISVKEGAADTGKLYIHSVQPQGNSFILRAMSVPETVFKETSKSWEGVTIEALAQEIAGNHGLGFENYETKEITRDYVRQDTESDFAFLQKRCKLEGASFLVYNDTLVLYDEAYMEAQTAEITINIDDSHVSFEPDENTSKMLSEITVINGTHTGTFKDEKAKTTAKKTARITEATTDNAMITDIAQSFCREANKRCFSAKLKSDLRRGVAACSVIALESNEKPQWNCNVFTYYVRHDFVNNKSTIHVRKTIDY